MKRDLIQSPAFIRTAKRIARRNPIVAEAIRRTLHKLQTDAFDPSLRTHKLKGELAGCWACSAGYDLRIVFERVQLRGAEVILLLSVGSHDEVY